MTKRIIALLLALILTVGLLPTVALADEGGETPATDPHPTKVEYENEDSPIHITKEVTDKDGQKYLTMEAYVTSPVEIKQKAVPLDIVLVLDVSGSMDDPFGQTNTYEKYTENYYQSLTNDFYAEQNNLYYKDGDKYYPVTIDVTPNYTKLSNTPTYINAYYSDYYVKKTSETEYKSLRFEWGYDNNWNYGYYMYVGEERIALVSDWYSEIDLPDYEFFTQDYSNATYTYKYATAENAYTTIGTSTGANTEPGYGFYRKGTGSVSKMKALQDAANNFIASVLENSTDLPDNTAHRISIVKFAGKEKTQIGDDTYRDGRFTYNYSQTVVGLTPVTSESANTLKNAVNKLHAAGATAADYGMKRAKAVLDARTGTDANRPAVVVMFTDGEPNHGNGFDQKVARDTIKVASELKKNKTTIYTIAVEKNADPDATIGNNLDMNKYMHAVSSNYPNATVNKDKLEMGERVASTKNYYYKATDAGGLKTVFQTISDEISNLPLVVDEETILYDTLTEHFDFAGVSSTDTSKVEVKVVPVKTGTLTGALEWDTANAHNLENPSVTVSGKSIEVKNFDYADNAVKILTNKDGTKTVQSGAKLVIKFPIKVDTENADAVWKAGEDYYATNTKDAGLKDYATVKDPDNRNQSTTLDKSPQLPVMGYTVTYGYTTDSAKNVGETMPSDSKVYLAGKTYTVGSATAPSGYTFEGWYTNDDGTGTKVEPGTAPAITGNVTLYGKFTKSVFPVDLSAYIKKHLTLNGNISALPNPESFEITLQEFTMNGDTKTNVGTAITAKTDEIVNTSSDVPFTVGETGKLELSLSVGTHTFDVTETPGSTDKMSYGTTPQTLTVTVGANGAVTAVNPTGGITITNTYNPDNAEFNLTGKFQKHLTSNTADVPSKSFELTITGTSDNTDKSTITGTAAVGALTASGASYTGSANFTFKKGAEDVSALNFTAAGSYTYKVQETAGSTLGMSYDTNEYILTVEVADENNDGALEIKSAVVTKDGQTVGNVANNVFTITNTFTAAELPLDPPKDPEGKPVAAGAKIVKSLTGDQKTEKFTAKIYEGQTEKATATADATTGTLAAFDGFGTLVFTEAKTYYYTIKEIPGSTAGMKYDERFRNGHTMNITVEAEDNKLVVKTVTIDDKEINLADDAWLTITNTYTEPKDPSVVSKKVVTTDAHFPGGLDTAIDEFKSKCKIEKVLYPTGDGTTNNTLEVPYGTDSVTLLYAITVNRGTESDKMDFADDGAEFVFAVGAEVTKDMTTGKFDVTFNTGVSTAVIYVAKTHTPLNFVGGKCTVENVISEEIKATTTVTEKDPDKLYLDFSKYVQKELAATGSKTASDVSFRVIVNGMESPIMMYNAGEEEVSTYVEFDPRYSTVLDVNFASITGGSTETKDFTGSYVEIDQVGIYYFELNEEDGKRTGVTYDDSTYKVYVYVKREGDKLVVGSFDIYKDGLSVAGETITFHNTIDTGKDDYYPIIIPTIINKDTGMLNKTDHFAYVIGYPDGTVHPNGQITRAEVATIFFRLLRDEVRDGAFTTSNTYSDVAYGKWYNNPISTMSALGIITGYPDGTFKPNKPITRAEFAAIAARFDETQSGKSATFSDVIGHWAAKEIGIAYYNDWIKGYPDGTFKPDQNITRAEAMTLINRVLERKPESPADLLTNMNKWTDNMDTSKWYYLDVQEATNSHGYTRKTFNYELWRQMLPDPDWSRYER